VSSTIAHSVKPIEMISKSVTFNNGAARRYGLAFLGWYRRELGHR